jgi:hypothetical protein
MRSATGIAFTAALCIAAASLASPTMQAQPRQDQLQSPEAFARLNDPQARAQALFLEAAKVLMHPRCMNCHPATDRPTQGVDMHVHYPPVLRGDNGGGVPGNTCAACHMESNTRIFPDDRHPLRSIPGNPRWGLAPIEMAWQGKSPGEICLQLKDPARNGGRDLALLHEHMAKDDLVGWGWQPGEGRDPVPGTQKVFGELIQAWIDAGAACP